VPRLRRSGFFLPVNPALMGWANLYRPYGAFGIKTRPAAMKETGKDHAKAFFGIKARARAGAGPVVDSTVRAPRG